MGRRVIANKKAVATVTSKHIARAVKPDLRKLGTTIVDRKNWVGSEDLGANKSAKTKFDGGEVWRLSSECGPPSKGKPDDHLPGNSNGGVVDGAAKATEGSPDVYVEGQPVVRFGDATSQNAGNCDGIIDVAENLDAYLAEPLAGDDGFGIPCAVPTKIAVPKGGGPGRTDGARGRGDDESGGGPSAGPELACGVTKVDVFEMNSKLGLRPAAAERDLDFTIEVMPLKVVNLNVEGQFCPQHPLWNMPDNVQKGGPKVEMPVTAAGIPKGGLLSMLANPLHKRWKAHRVTCVVHDGDKVGEVVVVSDQKLAILLAEDKGTSAKDPGKIEDLVSPNAMSQANNFAHALAKKLSFLPCLQFTFFVGSLSFMGEWEAQRSHRCLCKYGLKGEVTIVDAAITFEKEFVYFLAGPAGAGVKAFFTVVEELFDVKLRVLTLTVKVGGALKAGGAGGMMVDRFGAVAGGYLDLKGGGELYADGKVQLNLFAFLKAGGGIRAQTGLESGGKVRPDPSLRVDGEVAMLGFSLKASLDFELDIGGLIDKWAASKLNAAILAMGWQIKGDFAKRDGKTRVKGEKLIYDEVGRSVIYAGPLYP